MYKADLNLAVGNSGIFSTFQSRRLSNPLVIAIFFYDRAYRFKLVLLSSILIM